MKVLITDPYPATAIAKLSSSLPCKIISTNDLNPSLPALKEADALLVRSRSRVTEGILKNAPHLKFVGTATSGTDHIDIEGCEKRNIKVASAPEGNAQSAAEHTLLLMLTLNRKITKAQQSLRNQTWRTHLDKGSELKGKTLGIVGLGRVGSKVAGLANAFGMQVCASDPYVPDEKFAQFGVQRMGFVELLRQSDILTFHVPLTQETKHMINRPTLEQLSTNVQIINASRGAVIDENELILWLEKGDIAGVALDVFNKEPLPSHSRLLELPNVVLTPHIGAFTEEAYICSSEIAVDQLVDYFSIEPQALDWTNPSPSV